MINLSNYIRNKGCQVGLYKYRVVLLKIQTRVSGGRQSLFSRTYHQKCIELSYFQQLQLVQRMKLNTAKTAEKAQPFTYKSPRQPLPPFQNSPNQSAKNSNASTRLSERSSSTKRVFIPRSQKLNTFFNEPRHVSSQRVITSPLEQYLPDFPASNPQPKPERIQFLKFNLNKDYFDEEMRNQARISLKQQTGRGENNAYNIGRATSRQKSTSGLNSAGCFGREKSDHIMGLKSEKGIGSARMKSPKILVHPVQRVMSKNTRNLHGLAKAKSLEYTFGLP